MVTENLNPNKYPKDFTETKEMCIRDRFWMIEPEIAFADLKDDMILAESMLKYVIRYAVSYTHLDVYKRQVCFDGSYDLSQCEYFYAYIFFKK